MKSIRLSACLAVITGVLAALPAQATWRVDTYNSKPVLTDDNWTIYLKVFHCCKSEAEEAWLNYSQALTDEDKERPTYPGGRCFGIKPTASYQPNAWLVWDSSPYTPPGLSVIVK